MIVVGRFWLAIMAVLLLEMPSAKADPVADFYRGKQVQMIVGYGAGGGYDIYARLLAKYLGAFIPGNPTIVVQNMTGAGSLVAANYLYARAPKDGTTIGMIDRGLPLMALLGTNANIRFDPLKFTWLGSASSFADDAFLLFVRKDAAAKSTEDARRPGGPKVVVGVTADGATDRDVGVLFRDALGFNLQLISGYPDGNSISLAVDRKEVDARLAGLSAIYTSRPEWLKSDTMHVLAQFARTTRHPMFPDVPTARELARDPTSLALVELAELPYQLSRPFVAPPDVPADRARALEAAVMQVSQSPDYRAEAQRLNLDVSPIDGGAVVKLIGDLAKSSPDVLARMKAIQSGQAVQ